MTDTPLSVTPPRDRSTTRLVALAAGGTLVAVLVGAVGAYLLLRQDSQPVAAPAVVSTTAVATTGPATFKVTGEVILPDGYSGTTTCRGADGYADIKVGAKVTVKDSLASPVGSGVLDVGTVKPAKGCVFPFAVPNVPTGKGTYEIQISHRLGPRYTEVIITTQNLVLTLGEQPAG